MSADSVAALNRFRNRCRVILLACVFAEAAAIVCLLTGARTPGLWLGIGALATYLALNRLFRRRFGEACAREQALRSLGLANARYLGRKPLDLDMLRATGLFPSDLALQSPLCLHAVCGEVAGRSIEFGETTFGCRAEARGGRAFSSGTLVSFPLPHARRALLLGDAAFRHPIQPEDYTADGLRQVSGSPKRSWTAMTEDGAAPDAVMLDVWDDLCKAAGDRAALSLKDGSAQAFFVGSFYTGEYPLHTAVTQSDLKNPLFPYLPTLMKMMTPQPNGAEPARENSIETA